MKKLFVIAAILIPALGFALSASEKAEFKVYGSCGMCEARIEKAARIDGVTSADWSQQTRMLTLEYDSEIVNLDDVHQSIADVGHDTEKVSASDEVYASLHACCQYERKEQEANKAPAHRRACCSSH